MKKLDKQNIILIILIVLLVIAIGYISIDKYLDAKQRQQISIFQEGMQAGYEQAIVQLVQQASACQPIPVYVGNQTMSFIAVECLQQEPR